jgi:hypothetical protein
MKKRNLRKLILNKETISTLNRIEMNENLAGQPKGVPSRIGVSCYTGHCCYSKKECDDLGDPPPEG